MSSLVYMRNLKRLSFLRKKIKKVLLYKKMNCVYFLVKGGKVVYVGESVSLFTRIGTHSLDKNFDSVYYIPMKFPKPLKMVRRYRAKGYPKNAKRAIVYEQFLLEKAFIKLLKPKYNKEWLPQIDNPFEDIKKYFRTGRMY